MKAVDDGLRRLYGVSTVKIALQANVVTITLDPKTEIDLRAIPKAIRDSGFAPGAMRLVARGTFEEVDGTAAFRVAGWRQALPLTSGGVAAGDGAVVLRVDYTATPVTLELTEGH